MYTLYNLWELKVKQDQQKQRKVIEEKTRTGKAPTENELQLKVYRLVIFFQSKSNQVEELRRQAQSIFQVVECAIWDIQWLQ